MIYPEEEVVAMGKAWGSTGTGKAARFGHVHATERIAYGGSWKSVRGSAAGTTRTPNWVTSQPPSPSFSENGAPRGEGLPAPPRPARCDPLSLSRNTAFPIQTTSSLSVSAGGDREPQAGLPRSKLRTKSP